MPEIHTIYFIKDNGRKKLLGEIIFSENDFQVEISSEKAKESVKKLLKDFFENGFRAIGDVFLDEPIKPDDPLFLNEVKNQLARKGYILIKKRNKLMPEKELQLFGRAEKAAERKPEVRENPLNRLKREIREMALGLQKEGVPVDDEARINPDKFRDVYPRQSIETDKMWIKNLEERWQAAAVSSYDMAWLYGREQTKEKVAQRNPVGRTWEMLATLILQKNLGKDFIVVRTSEYDDARYKVDNIILDRRTGHIVCAFDEVGEAVGKIFEEKKKNVLDRNRQRGGTDLKYGISFEEKAGKMALRKGSVYQIPLLYFAASKEDIKKTLGDPSLGKEIFRAFVKSAKEQIKEIKNGPVQPKLGRRLDFFESVLEKL